MTSVLRSNYDFSVKVKPLPTRLRSNYDFSVKVKPLPKRSRSNYEFSVKVTLLHTSQDQTMSSVLRSHCYTRVKIKL